MLPQYDKALEDITHGAISWRMWGRFGWQEIKRRYRRTMIGPFWTTLSVGFFIGALGFIWANLWGQNPKEYLPYLCSGFLVWVLMAAIISEGCSVYVSAEAIIKQIRFSYTILALSIVWRNVIVFFHNLLIYALVAIYGEVQINLQSLFIIPGLALLCLNGVWVCLVMGLVCLRFRDIQQIVTSILQVAIFVTPILWSVEQLGQRGIIYINFNLLYHYLNIVRAPMLGQAPTILNWQVAIVGGLVGWGLTIFLYSRYRRRIPYWL